ncbi:MAG: glucokinase [Proteobacteria bacterium]|nr:glucokinase [Pseudomonadota bacterium]
MATRLAADVGGTNTRIALFDLEANKFRALKTYINRDYASFQDVIAQWLTGLEEAAPSQACIAIAAVPSDDLVSMTNMNWSFSCKALAAEFRFRNFRWINDFEANAFSLPYLGKADRDVIHTGGGHEQGKLAVIGPGTGLGGATIEPQAQTWNVCACEPGSTSLAPANALELELFKVLLQRHSQVYAELLVSGPGLLRLYKLLGDITDKPGSARTPADVSQLALGEEEETAVLALKTFSALLGSIAGDFSLATGSYGGLFLAGGIVPTMIPFLRASDFHQRFCDKGAMSANLGQIPVYAITTAQPGLIGAAHAPLN